MSYVYAPSGTLVEYPFTFERLRKLFPDVSYPKQPSDARLADFGVFRIEPTAKPAASDPITKNVVEVLPTLVGGVWTQTWGEEDATAEQIARRQRDAADETTRSEIKADSFVSTFVAMTPAQVSNYVTNNVTDLASARALLVKMALMLLLLARREFR